MTTVKTHRCDNCKEETEQKINWLNVSIEGETSIQFHQKLDTEFDLDFCSIKCAVGYLKKANVQ